MKQLLIILLCSISLSISAADYLPFSAPMPMPYSTMTSVNQSSYMTTGSKYKPSVHAIEASSPIAYAPGRPRRSGFNDIGTGQEVGSGGVDSYDPTNTQFSPVGSALIPLLIMALLYAVVLYRRKTKAVSL